MSRARSVHYSGDARASTICYGPDTGKALAAGNHLGVDLAGYLLRIVEVAYDQDEDRTTVRLERAS